MKKAVSFIVVAALIGLAAVMQLSNMGIINIGGGSSTLEGMWLGSTGETAIGWLFSGNYYEMWVNTSMQQSGTFTLNGNTLLLTIKETGGSERLIAQFGADGRSMSLTDEGGVTVAFQKQQNGQAQTPQPVPPQPTPPRQQGSILEGRWGTSHNGTQIIFVFTGDKYEIWTGGNMEDGGHFWIEGNEFNFWTNVEGKVKVSQFQMSPDGNSFTLSGPGGSYLLTRMQ